mmetsp:Transcript_25379/g.40379  ORF Transcript_25379/g.40379 Transcript_25379/m.40379 type:complete len:217 (+) Transcript_25379:164-814(+)
MQQSDAFNFGERVIHMHAIKLSGTKIKIQTHRFDVLQLLGIALDLGKQNHSVCFLLCICHCRQLPITHPPHIRVLHMRLIQCSVRSFCPFVFIVFEEEHQMSDVFNVRSHRNEVACRRDLHLTHFDAVFAFLLRLIASIHFQFAFVRQVLVKRDGIDQCFGGDFFVFPQQSLVCGAGPSSSFFLGQLHLIRFRFVRLCRLSQLSIIGGLHKQRHNF